VKLPGRHHLFVYGDDDRLAAHIVPFLREGVDSGEAVLTVLPPRKRDLLREALGPQADAIPNTDRDAFYTRPEAAIAEYDARVRGLLRDGATAVRVFGELPPCRTQEESDAWITYEALLNHAFAHHPVWILCGLDTREQPQSVIDGSWRTHPHVLTDDWGASPHFQRPADTVRSLAPEPKRMWRLHRIRLPSDALAFRERLGAKLDAAGVPPAEAAKLLLAASEVLRNALLHGGGAKRFRYGRVGDRFVLEIADHGPGIEDPLAGHLPPAGNGAAGLWVARQLTRRLEMLRSRRGFAVRLWV
jgi:anti-sigma regulatory factor (Ser/Thr protein kinase)